MQNNKLFVPPVKSGKLRYFTLPLQPRNYRLICDELFIVIKLCEYAILVNIAIMPNPIQPA